MRHYLRTRLTVLHGNAGDTDSNLKESLISQPLSMKMLVAAGALLIAVFGLVAALTSSAAASVRFNASNLEFSKDVRTATIVRGFGTDRVALLIDAAGGCTIKQWYASSINGAPALESSSTTSTGKCATTTVVPAPSTGTMRGADLATIAFTYQNLGGRPVVFDSSGNASLSTATMPAGVVADDWNDTRPYRAQLDLTSAKTNLAKYSKQATLVGTTAVVNVAKAANIRFVPPTTPVLIPSQLQIGSIVRSATTGTAYSGAREGITVTVLGAVCSNGPTTLVTSYTPEGPAGLAAVNTVTTATLTGAASTVDLGGVPNSTTGAVQVTASCGTGSMTTSASANYHQDLPNPVVTVTQGSPANAHVVSWTAVSSLPTSFVASWSDTQGHTGSLAPTTALTQTATQSVGQTYGIQFSYSVAATVNGATSTGGPTSIVTPWPVAPKATTIWYIWTGGANYAWGKMSWTDSGSCPAGTNKFSRHTTNMAGNSAGQLVAYAGGSSPWNENVTVIPWTMGAALQGWTYQWSIEQYCSNGASSSAIVAAQSTTGTTPMAAPATPVWNAYNIYTYTSPIYWTHSTCNAPSGCSSLAVNYLTYCPAGSSVNFSQWTSQDWGGGIYYHPFGFGDYWKLPGSSALNVYYFNAYYTCATPYKVSPISPYSGTTTVTVYP